MRVCRTCRAEVGDDAERCPRDGGALEEMPHPWLGRTVEGGYVIDTPLEASGITASFLARGGGRPVVVEGLRIHLAQDPAMKARFERGAGRALSLSDIPGIVTIYARGELDGVPYIVTELLDGVPLSTLLARGPLDPPRAVDIAVGIARLLDRAHARGVVHRNLKPGNVYVVEQAGKLSVSLRGFAIASSVDDGRMTAAGEVFGTPAYLAPEQAASKPVSPATDLYSLGVLLFEMLTGRPPFEARTSLAILLKHVSDPAPRPSSLVDGIPPAIESLVLRLLEKDPAARPRSAAAVDEALADPW